MPAEYVSYSPGEGEKAYIDKVTTRWNNGLGHWRRLFDWWRALLRNYDMEWDLIADEEGNIAYPYASQVFTPFTFERIEVEIPIVVGMLLDHDPPFKAINDDGDWDDYKVEMTENLLAWQLRKRGFKKDMIHIIQQVVKIGTQILRVKWVEDEKTYTETEHDMFYDVPIGWREEQVKETIYSGPYFERIPFYRFVIDPTTPPCNLQAARYVMEQDILTWEKFQEEAGKFGYDNVKHVKMELFGHKEAGKKGPDDSGRVELADEDIRSVPGDEYMHDVKMLYHWDRSDYIVCAQTTGDSAILLLREPFHKKYNDGDYPHVAIHNRISMDSGVEASSDSTYDAKPGGFYPKGDLDPLHGLQQAHNTTVNQRIDNVTVNLRNPIAIISGAIENEELLTTRGWVQNPVLRFNSDLLGGRNINQMYQPLIAPDMFGSSWAQQTEKIEQWGNDALSTFQTMRGDSDKNIKTASAFMQATANSMKRMALKAFIMSAMGMSDLLTKMSNLNKETIPTDYEFSKKQEGVPVKLQVNRQDLIRNLKFTLRTIPPYSKAIVAEQVTRMLPLLEKYAPYADAKRAVEILLENMEWLESADEIIPRSDQRISFFDLQNMAAELARKNAMLNPAPNMGNNPNVNKKPPEMDGEAEVQKLSRPGLY